MKTLCCGVLAALLAFPALSKDDCNYCPGENLGQMPQAGPGTNTRVYFIPNNELDEKIMVNKILPGRHSASYSYLAWDSSTKQVKVHVVWEYEDFGDEGIESRGRSAWFNLEEIVLNWDLELKK